MRSAILRHLLAVTLIAAGGLSTGCDVDMSGEREELSFHFANSNWVTGDETPGTVAVGSSVEIYVTEHDVPINRWERLEIADAYSEDAQSIEVDQITDKKIRLDAHQPSAPEGVELHVTAHPPQSDDEAGPTETESEPAEEPQLLEDFVRLGAAEVADVALEPCPYYLRGETVRMPFRMKNAEGERITGYGVYPFAVEPADHAEVVQDNTMLDIAEFELGDEPGRVEIISEFSAASVADFELLEPHQVDEAVDLSEALAEDEDTDIDEWDETDDGIGSSEHTVTEGESTLIDIFALYHQDQRVCGPSGDAFEVSTDADDICRPEHRRFAVAGDAISVEGLAAGDCRIDVAVPSADHERSYDIVVNPRE